MTYPDDFELFWHDYPARWDRERSVKIKRKKHPAYISWQKLTHDEKQECLGKRKKIYSSEGSWPRDCVTWLNQRGWDEIELDEAKWEPTIKIDMKQIAPTVKLEVWQERKKLGL